MTGRALPVCLFAAGWSFACSAEKALGWKNKGKIGCLDNMRGSPAFFLRSRSSCWRTSGLSPDSLFRDRIASAVDIPCTSSAVLLCLCGRSGSQAGRQVYPRVGASQATSVERVCTAVQADEADADAATALLSPDKTRASKQTLVGCLETLVTEGVSDDLWHWHEIFCCFFWSLDYHPHVGPCSLAATNLFLVKCTLGC